MSLPDSLTLDDFADILPDPFILVNKSGEILYGNARAKSLILSSENEAPQNIKDLFEEPAEVVERYLLMCRRNLQPVPGKFTVRTAVDSFDSFLVHGGRILRDNVDAICLDFHDKSKAGESERFRTLNDTVERLQLEIKTRRQFEAILEAEKQTLACVISGQPLPVAMNLLATALEKQVEGMLTSILLLDEDQSLRHTAAPSLPAEYSAAIDGLQIGPDVGSCGNAAFTGVTTIAEDITEDARWEPFRELAAAANLRACWSSPIFSSDGDVLGTLASYYRVPRAPTDDELRLIANSAYVAGIVIERYRSQEALNDLLEREKNLREAAEQQNKAKDQFLAMLGHELRNPLSAIANAAFALEAKSGGDDAVSKLYRIVVNETSLLKRILDDLLDLNRLGRGALKLQREKLHLGAFLDELQIAIKSAYPERAIRFEVDGELGEINADASRLRQSVQNLLDNAVKYSEVGDDVHCRVTANADAITIEVADTGEGIAAEILPTIFEPFVQADKSLDRPASGVGLGLALVKRFTEMHGGRIHVESDGVGRGSLFRLVIPRTGGTTGAAVAPSKPNGTDTPRRACKVLVVEDNTNAREGLCQLLEIWGHEVFSAADGKQALDVFRDQQPDVALVDIGLPEIDGYEVAATVRKNAANTHIKLVALTGYGQDADRQRAIDAGFDAHIVKPANIKDLISVLGDPAPQASASSA